MEGPHVVGRRPFMPDSTLSRRRAALLRVDLGNSCFTRHINFPRKLQKNHKIGILYGCWCTEWDVDYMPYLEKVKQLGFDTLEINTFRLTKMSDAEIEHFMGRAKELQIDVLGVIGVP